MLTDSRRQSRIAILKETDDGLNRVEIRALERQHLSGLPREPIRDSSDFIEEAVQARAGEQREDHLDSDVCLGNCIAARLEKSGEVGRGWIRSVELRQRRND